MVGADGRGLIAGVSAAAVTRSARGGCVEATLCAKAEENERTKGEVIAERVRREERLRTAKSRKRDGDSFRTARSNQTGGKEE